MAPITSIREINHTLVMVSHMDTLLRGKEEVSNYISTITTKGQIAVNFDTAGESFRVLVDTNISRHDLIQAVYGEVERYLLEKANKELRIQLNARELDSLSFNIDYWGGLTGYVVLVRDGKGDRIVRRVFQRSHDIKSEMKELADEVSYLSR